MKGYNNIKIAPSLLAADFSRLGDEIRRVSDAGAALIHIDVMDGHFVPNIAIGVDLVKSIRSKTEIPFDIHMMLSNPQDHIKKFVEAGADIITVHAEVNSIPIGELLDQVRSHKVKTGLAIRPKTSVALIEPHLEFLDLVLPMSVEPGFAGQKFIPEILDKISRLKKMIEAIDRKIELEADGGINAITAPLAIEAGATILVAGTAIFKSDNYRKSIAQLRSDL